MAFPTKTNKQTLSEVFNEIQQTALFVKSSTQASLTTLSAGQIEGRNLVSLTAQLANHYRKMDVLSRTTGLAAYAASEYTSDGIDFVAEFQSMMTALAAVVAWVRSNVPTDGEGYLLLETMDAQGVVRSRVYSVNQTAALRTLMQTLVDSIA